MLSARRDCRLLRSRVLQAVQLAPLAMSIARRGSCCIALDVTGHGSSPGQRSNWRCFIDDVAELTTTLGTDIFAYVGHSAGGLTMMAARPLKGIGVRHYICICAPSHPFPPVRAVQQTLQPPAPVQEAYRQYLAQQFDSDWRSLETGQGFQQAGAHLLLFYDEKDRCVDRREGDRIQALCPGARLIKSTTYGHTRVLAAAELELAIAALLHVPSSDQARPSSSQTATNPA